MLPNRDTGLHINVNEHRYSKHAFNLECEETLINHDDVEEWPGSDLGCTCIHK